MDALGCFDPILLTFHWLRPLVLIPRTPIPLLVNTWLFPVSFQVGMMWTASNLFLMATVSQEEPTDRLLIVAELPIESREIITPVWLLILVHCIFSKFVILEDTLSTSAFWLMSPTNTDRSKFLGFQSRAPALSGGTNHRGFYLTFPPIIFQLISTGCVSVSSPFG